MGTSQSDVEEKEKKNYKVVILKTALKQLQVIPSPYKEKIVSKIDGLAFNPRPFGCEKLTNRENEYMVRYGPYRIVYSIFDKMLLIEVVNIDHRKQVYR